MKTLLFAVAILFLVSVGTVSSTIHYRNLYLSYKPITKTITHDSVTYKTGFNENRSESYECIPQQPIKNDIAMICTSPNSNIQVYCTVAPTPGIPPVYFC